MKVHLFLKYILRVRLFRAQQTATNGKRKNGPEHYTQTRQKNSAGDAPSKQDKTTKTAPKSDSKSSQNRLLFKPPARPPPRSPRRPQKTPPGAPKGDPRAPKAAPRAPQRAPGPPPGRPKMVKNASGGRRRIWSQPSWGPGAPQETPKRPPEALWEHSGVIFEPPGGHF